MPLYFPRNKEEEDFALNELPDDIGKVKFSVCFVCDVFPQVFFLKISLYA